VEKLKKMKELFVCTQLLGVESSTALCLFEGPEGGTSPLGKKLKTMVWYER